MKLKQLCFIALIVLSLRCTDSVDGQAVPLGLHGSPQYVDLVRSPRFQAVNGDMTLDQQGWPQQDFEWILDVRRNKPWNGPDFAGHNDNMAGVYQMSFKGQAVLSTAGSDSPNAAAFVNQTYNASTQTTNVSLVIQPNHFLFILSFTMTQRAGQTTNNTGVTDVHLYLPGYSLSSPQLFTNEFLSIVEKLNSATFRSFDTGINSYNIWYGTDLVNNTWATRSLPTDAYWPLPSRNVGNISGLAMPWEIFIQICIQTNTPGWFNLPVGADDDYVMNFALLLKNGNQYTKAYPSDLPIYIEYSNEVWNFGFSQYIYNAVKAKQNNLTVEQNYVKRVFQISDIFRKVYGNAAIGTQIRLMCMWQYNTWLAMQQTLVWAQGIFGNPVKYYIWGIGEAPYVNPLENGNVPYGLLDPSGVDRIIDSMYTSAGLRRQAFTSWQSVATFFGINVGGYESGPSLSAGIEGEASRSPRLADFEYRYYMENYFATGAQTVNYFALGPGGPSAYGDWYLFEHWGEYDIGRFQGYMKVSGQPYPAIIVGAVLPWFQGETITIDASQTSTGNYYKPGSYVSLCASGCWPYYGSLTYLLRSTTIGAYQLTLTGSSATGATLAVWLDNQLVKSGVVLPSKTGNVSVPLQITVIGLHSIALFASGPGNSVFEPGKGLSITLINGKGNPVPPSAPLNVVASSTSNGVYLLWEVVATATTYTVQRSTTSGGPYMNVGSSSNSSYVDTTVTNGVLYYYVVNAQNSAGNSALSIQVQVIQVQHVIPAPPVVNISSGIQYGGSPISQLGQAYLKWSPVPNAQYYKIVRITGQATTLATQLGTCYYDATIAPGNTYSYNVTAVNYVGSSVAITVNTTVPTTSVPGAPTALSVNGTGSIAYLKWNQAIWSYPEFGELFVVQKASSSSGPWNTLQAISTNNIIDYSFKNGSSCYRVWGSSSKGGNSAQPSNVVCA